MTAMTLADVKMCSDCRHCGTAPGSTINICAKWPDVRLRLARDSCLGHEWEEMPHQYGGSDYERTVAKASKREIFMAGGRYKMCDIVYSETNEIGTITGKYMIARDDEGHEHIVRIAYGTWSSYSIIDLVEGLKERDQLAQPVAVDQPLGGTRVQMTNELEAEKMERELIALSERANRLSSRTSRSARHRWNRVWSNINSAIAGCREIIGATAESK